MPDHAAFAYVAKLLSDEDLILNVGRRQGIGVGAVFEVLDPNALDITDPVTNEPLGSIDRVLVEVRVTQAEDLICIAQKHPRRASPLTSAVNVFAGISERPATLVGDKWPEGVKRGYPARLKTSSGYEQPDRPPRQSSP